MQGGDLSDRLPPRWLFTFEGVIANVPEPRGREYRLAMRLGRHRRAVSRFEIEPHVSKVLWDLYWRRDYRFDVVTFLGDDMAEHIEKRLERENVPLGNVISTQPDTLAKRLAYMPDVLYVVHADPSHHLSYGNRGLLVTDPDLMRLF